MLFRSDVVNDFKHYLTELQHASNLNPSKMCTGNKVLNVVSDIEINVYNMIVTQISVLQDVGAQTIIFRKMKTQEFYCVSACLKYLEYSFSTLFSSDLVS